MSSKAIGRTAAHRPVETASHELAELARLVRAGDGVFRWHPVRPDEGSALFGGQLLCQALLAAGAALPATMSAASLRMHFLRRGNLCDPVEYEVIPAVDQADRVVFEVTASQNNRQLAVAVVAFGATSVTCAAVTEQVACSSPHELPDALDLANAQGVRTQFSQGYPFDVRYASDPPWLSSAEPVISRVWMRASSRLPRNAFLHAGALAYASDITVMDAARAQLGLRWDMSPPGGGVTIGHTIWFHLPWRADDWFRIEATSPCAAGGRALGAGHLLTPNGAAVATVIQEARVYG